LLISDLPLHPEAFDDQGRDGSGNFGEVEGCYVE